MDEVKFKNTSKMDDNEISLFQNFALKKVTLISSIVFTLLFVGGGVGLCFLDLTMGITLIVCGVAGGVILLPYLLKESVKKENKIALGDRKYLNTFEFYEDYVMVSTQATKDKQSNDYLPVANQRIEYQDLFKLVCYREYIFLYINQKQSFILNCRGMTQGIASDLVKFLKSKGVKIIDKSSEVMPQTVNNKKRG